MLLRYAADPFGKRRPINAQRFNVSGGARVLYLAEDHMTCFHEIQAFSWPATSTAIIPVQFDLKAVVDLCDPRVQGLLHTSAAELASNFRSVISGAAPTQVLGERCAACGRNRRPTIRIAGRAGQKRLGRIGAGSVDIRVVANGRRPSKQSPRQIAVNFGHRRFAHLQRLSDQGKMKPVPRSFPALPTATSPSCADLSA